MPSADFCTVIPAPRGAGSPDGQPCRSPRVLRTHFHAYACRIYVMAFCASIGFRRFRTAYPAMPPRIRFLFVRPAICLGLPSDSQSPAKPLPLASTSPCRVCGGLPPLSERALPGAPKKNPPGRVFVGNKGGSARVHAPPEHMAQQADLLVLHLLEAVVLVGVLIAIEATQADAGGQPVDLFHP